MMRAHLDAIKALLAPTGMPVHVVRHSGTLSHPYVLVWAPPGRLVSDSLQTTNDLRDVVGVTTVAATPEAVYSKVDAVRACLLDVAPTVAGWHCDELKLRDSQPVTEDRDVKLPNSNAFPCFAVDLYDLSSQRLI